LDCLVLAKQAPSAPLIGALSSSPFSRLASGAPMLDRSISFAFQDVDSIARSRNLRRRKPTAASIRPSSQSYRGVAECRGAPAASQASSCGCPQPASSIAELFRLAGSGTVGGWEQPPPQRVFVVNSTTPPHLGACWAAAPLVCAGPTWPLYPYPHRINVGAFISIPCLNHRAGAGLYIGPRRAHSAQPNTTQPQISEALADR